MLRPTLPMLARARPGTSSGALATPARPLVLTPVSSPTRCLRPTSSRVSPLTRLSSAASATVGTKSPPRRRTCSSSSSVSSLVLSSMVSSSHSYPALSTSWPRVCAPNGWLAISAWRRLLLLLQALTATRSYGHLLHPAPLAEPGAISTIQR